MTILRNPIRQSTRGPLRGPLQGGFGGVVYPDLIINGGFNTDTDWTKGDVSVTITGGEAVFASTPNGLRLFQQNSINPSDFEVNETYRFVFQISSYTEGTLRVRLGNSGVLTEAGVNGIGEFSLDVAAPATFSGFIVQIFAGGTTTLAIDSVEARKV
jgi:hypothetical protein